MKRTPLKPSLTRIRQHRGLRRGPMRSPEYKTWLRGCVCIACRIMKFIYRDRLCASGGVMDACHTSNNGMSSKGPDSGCAPLCRSHHSEYDSGREAFELKYNVSMAKEAAIHYALFLSEAA